MEMYTAPWKDELHMVPKHTKILSRNIDMEPDLAYNFPLAWVIC